MTKFILHGGTNTRTLAQMQGLFDEIVRGQPKPARVLLIFFAKSESDWPGVLKFVKSGFAATNHTVELVVASTKLDEFQSQLQEANAVFVYGGETDLLMAKLKEVDPSGNVFRAPVFAGSSAGAHVLSKWYYRRSKGGVQKGFGVLPIKLLVHYDSKNAEGDINWHAVENELMAIDKDLPFYKIAEGEQEIIERNKK